MGHTMISHRHGDQDGAWRPGEEHGPVAAGNRQRLVERGLSSWRAQGASTSGTVGKPNICAAQPSSPNSTATTMSGIELILIVTPNDSPSNAID
jgi:hypothetical protein